MNKTFGIIALLGVAAFAISTGPVMKAFNENYKVKDGSEIKKAGCALCHTTARGGKLNPYGSDLAAALKAANLKKPTAEIFAKVDKLDSNKNGTSNGDEIKGDKLPGAK